MPDVATARVLEVDADAAGARLDVLLARSLGLSRADVRWLLARGGVRVDGREVGPGDKGARLSAGARVEVEQFTPRAELHAVPEPEPAFPVLAEGGGWLVLDKPAGVPVHPLEEGETGTLLNFAVARAPELHGVGEGGLRSGVVHRLDVDTSGAVVLATRDDAWRRLRHAFRRHRVHKRYRAIALGSLDDTGRAEVGLVVTQHRPARVRVFPDVAAAGAGARTGRLEWHVVERLGDACLVEVDLETGFLHQVRATLAWLGAPVAGDPVYGRGPDDRSGAPRQMLHAAHLAFQEVVADSPDPDDFRTTLDRLRAG
jgi:23S rRNA pseudouridine1911/1915/1917 synthase